MKLNVFAMIWNKCNDIAGDIVSYEQTWENKIIKNKQAQKYNMNKQTQLNILIYTDNDLEKTLIDLPMLHFWTIYNHWNL